MTPDHHGIAVLLDGALKAEGEIQIKRKKPFGDTDPIELTVWEPTGGQFPHASIRVQGCTIIEVLNNLEKRLEQKTESRN